MIIEFGVYLKVAQGWEVTKLHNSVLGLQGVARVEGGEHKGRRCRKDNQGGYGGRLGFVGFQIFRELHPVPGLFYCRPDFFMTSCRVENLEFRTVLLNFAFTDLFHSSVVVT